MIDRAIFQVSESVWCLKRHSYQTCSYAIKSGDRIILIDAGMDSDGHDVKELLQCMKSSIASVDAILLTHWHNDHAAGAAVIQAESGCKVYCHKSEATYLQRFGESKKSGAIKF
jgi:glyoxylase-like metal-dependent hydrolase (beta-lactamase superfamily II)